ncbi:hypothetical protein B0T25DRAFT_566185 [Lasiosphaeria hispida]|uniref:Uncharacterized protein n=1 Tax=Lasiosphaeria hispida TaxID=260671 RepID=A0AAJ0HLB4_9PEZI|nr:hypothetical protein B0T25DRAFT_566185 [Lasiosphaeria hispida]
MADQAHEDGHADLSKAEITRIFAEAKNSEVRIADRMIPVPANLVGRIVNNKDKVTFCEMLKTLEFITPENDIVTDSETVDEKKKAKPFFFSLEVRGGFKIGHAERRYMSILYTVMASPTGIGEILVDIRNSLTLGPRYVPYGLVTAPYHAVLSPNGGHGRWWTEDDTGDSSLAYPTQQCEVGEGVKSDEKNFDLADVYESNHPSGNGYDTEFLPSGTAIPSASLTTSPFCALLNSGGWTLHECTRRLWPLKRHRRPEPGIEPQNDGAAGFE